MAQAGKSPAFACIWRILNRGGLEVGSCPQILSWQGAGAGGLCSTRWHSYQNKQRNNIQAASTNAPTMTRTRPRELKRRQRGAGFWHRNVSPAGSGTKRCPPPGHWSPGPPSRPTRAQRPATPTPPISRWHHRGPPMNRKMRPQKRPRARGANRSR